MGSRGRLKDPEGEQLVVALNDISLFGASNHIKKTKPGMVSGLPSTDNSMPCLSSFLTPYLAS